MERALSFPSFDPVAETLAVFRHFGDRIGQKSMLLITLLLMGVPTLAIGLIPSYESIAYWAAALLVAGAGIAALIMDAGPCTILTTIFG